MLSAGEILAHRIIWSFVFMVVLLLVSRKWKSFVSFLKEIAQNRKTLFSLFLASVLISINWGTFIWAVNAGNIMETSLGYYINPLVSVLLGVIVLKEKLSKQQVFAFSLAGVGVLILGIYFGSNPMDLPYFSRYIWIVWSCKKNDKSRLSYGAYIRNLNGYAICVRIYHLYSVYIGCSVHYSASNSFTIDGRRRCHSAPTIVFCKRSTKSSAIYARNFAIHWSNPIINA